MKKLSLDAANDYLANDPDINKLKEFAADDLQEVEPRFAAMAIEGNAFADEIKLYLSITQEMGLTPHAFPNRVPVKSDELKKHAQYVLGADYVTNSVPWPKVEEITKDYVEALLRFTGTGETVSQLKYRAFTAHAIDDQYYLAGMDSLTSHTFNCGLFIFGWKETAPDTGFTYVMGISAAGED